MSTKNFYMKITLFHLPNSRSQRILWLLEELKCDYKLILSNAVPDDQKMKYPTVDILDHGTAFRLTETSAIAEFLSHHFKFLPDHLNNVQDSANFFFWKNYADGSFMPDLALKQVFNQIVIQTPWPLRFICKSIQYGFHKGYLDCSMKMHMDKIEQHLTGRTWVSGEFGICDILLWFPLLSCHVSFTQGNYPNIVEYLKRIADRPAFKAALKKGEFSEEIFYKYWL